MRENSNHEEMVECHYQGSIIYVPVRTFIEVTMKMRLEKRRFVRYKEGAKHYSMSENKFRELADAAEAVHYFGKIFFNALVNPSSPDTPPMSSRALVPRVSTHAISSVFGSAILVTDISHPSP